jgi:hypothetical protein
MKRFPVSLGFWVLFTVALAVAAADSDKPNLQVSVDRRNILIGDRIRYEVNITFPERLEISAPVFEDGLMGSFEIKDSGSSRKNSMFKKVRIIHWYSITNYSIGKQTIPQYLLRYRIKDKGAWQDLKSDAIDIMVESILPRGKVVYDIKDIKGPLYFFGINWIFVFILLVLMAASFFIIRSYIKRRLAASPRFAHEIAIDELEAARGLLARTGDVKGYYVGISDSVRRYIERVFSLKAPEMTTEEFLNSLKDSMVLTSDHKAIMEEFLNACDLVKFAKYAPRKNETEAVFDGAKKFIEETKGISITRKPIKV